MLSLLVHVVLAIVLFFGNFSSEHKPTPKPTANVKPIEAVAIDKTALAKRVNELTKQKSDAVKAEKKRIQELENRAKAAKQKRTDEQAQIAKLEKARKQKEQEKRKADAAAKIAKTKANKAEKLRKEKVAEQKKAEKAAATAKTKREAEEKAAATAKAKREAEEKAAQYAAEQRKKQEAEKKRKAQEAKEQALQEALLAEQLAAEVASRQQARNQQVVSEVNRYNSLISQAIDRSVLKDQATMAGKTCSLIISITSSGFVTNVTSSDGDAIVCNAAKTGVLKLGTVPMSENPDVYSQFKQFELVYIPKFQ